MKNILLILTIFMAVFCSAKELPIPQGFLLYTEFDSTRTSPYLKKPVIGTGYIGMKGKEIFVFKQNTPAEITIRKNAEKISFQKGNNPPMTFSTDAEGMDNGNISILFSGDNEKIKEIFNIDYSSTNGKDAFRLTPVAGVKSVALIEYIYLESVGDKVDKIDLVYKNKTVIKYNFHNSVTGALPHEEIFK